MPVEFRPPPGIGSSCDPQRLLLRCPFPSKLAEARIPGTVDEKLGCERGVHVDTGPVFRYLHPDLYGFGCSDIISLLAGQDHQQQDDGFAADS